MYVSPVLTSCWAARIQHASRGNTKWSLYSNREEVHSLLVNDRGARLTWHWRATWRLQLLLSRVCEGSLCPLVSGSPRSVPPLFPPCPVHSQHPAHPSAPRPHPGRQHLSPHWRLRWAVAEVGSGRLREGWRGKKWSRYCCGHRMMRCPERHTHTQTSTSDTLLFTHVYYSLLKVDEVLQSSDGVHPLCCVITWATAGKDESVAPFTSATQMHRGALGLQQMIISIDRFQQLHCRFPFQLINNGLVFEMSKLQKSEFQQIFIFM